MPEHFDLEQSEPDPSLGPSLVARTELSISIQSKIRAFRSIAAWQFRKIGTELGVPSSTVFRICNQVYYTILFKSYKRYEIY